MKTQVALEVGEDWLQVLDITLPRNPSPKKWIPSAERFRHLCADGSFLLLARQVAAAVKAGVPCLLEGATSVSKTTVVLWLAHLCGRGVIRLNLNGQTDTGELVGKYVPDERNGGWRFQEGAIPQAMREGWWVILDEINLAEPQILERLNPVLEDPAGLVLSEHDNRSFGAGGDVPIDPGFRIFATMNPLECAGRREISASFRDRWSAWIHAFDPSHEEIQQFLKFLTAGKIEPFVWRECLWTLPDAPPLYPELASCPEHEELLGRFAIFHSRISRLCGKYESEEDEEEDARRERLFTRRSLLHALRMISSYLTEGKNFCDAMLYAALEVYIIGLGIGPNTRAIGDLFDFHLANFSHIQISADLAKLVKRAIQFQKKP